MTTMTGRPPAPVAARTSYVDALKRYFWIPILCMVAAAGLAYVLDKQLAHKYTGKALLQLQDQNLTRTLLGLQGNSSNDTATATIALIPQVDQPRTAARATRILGGRADALTVKKIQKDTKVELDKDSGLVAVEAKTTSDPKLAADLANAYAQGYVDLRSESDLAQIRDAVASLRRQYNKARRSGATNQVDAQTAAQLAVRLQSLRLFEQTRPKTVGVAKSALVPVSQSGIAPKRAALFAAILGLLLGLALLVVRAQTDTRVRSPEEFEPYFGATTLARIPRSRALKRRRPWRELGAGEAEAFRVLLARLRNHRVAGASASLMVTSSCAREGKSTTSWYLASAAALSGVRTLLLEVDRARPSGLPSSMAGDGAGVREVLAGERAVPDVVRHFPVDGDYGFDVIQAGRSHATAHLGGGDAVGDLLAWGEHEYDLVIIETPPLTLAADAVPFARRADAILVVVRNDVCTPDSAIRLKTILDGLDSPLVGLVAVGYTSNNYYDY
jgi:Mrp family chromosome partitioning ATPase